MFTSVRCTSPQNSDPDFKPQPFDVRISDFDNASFLLLSNDAETVSVSLALPCYHQIAEFGAKAAIDKAFGAYVMPEAEKGFDVTVQVRYTIPHEHFILKPA